MQYWTERQAIKATAEKSDGVNVLINNAGGVWPPVYQYEPEGFEASLRLNLLSGYTLAHACRELLAASTLPGGASLIGIASLSSYLAVTVVPGYGAAKAGLVQLAKTLATEWADQGIRVNNVAAGHVITRMTGHMPDDPEASDPILQRTPLRRWGQPEEIADAVLFLARSGASFITGETLVVAGGCAAVGGENPRGLG